jgi:hypothetical protein
VAPCQKARTRDTFRDAIPVTTGIYLGRRPWCLWVLTVLAFVVAGRKEGPEQRTLIGHPVPPKPPDGSRLTQDWRERRIPLSECLERQDTSSRETSPEGDSLCSRAGARVQAGSCGGLVARAGTRASAGVPA